MRNSFINRPDVYYITYYIKTFIDSLIHFIRPYHLQTPQVVAVVNPTLLYDVKYIILRYFIIRDLLIIL